MGEKQSQFEQLLLTHLDGAYNLAFWLTGNEGDAQAIIEKAYQQAREGFGTFREADVRTWLLRIVLRVAHGGVADGNHPVPPDNGAGKLEPPTNMPATAALRPRHEGTGHEGTGQKMSRALIRLPVELREILVLHEVEGWNYHQLAAALGTTGDIVIARLSLARRSLRQGLGDARSR